MAVGSAITGLLAYVFFALATRTLGADRAAGVSVLWTWWSFAAAAVTFPLQHWIIRAISAARGDEGAVRAAAPRLAAVSGSLALATGLGTWLLRDQLFHHEGIAFPALVAVVTAGAAFTALVRGVLTARGRLQAVAATLVAENAVRCLLALGLAVAGSTDARLFGLALALGQLVGLGWPSALRLGRDGAPEPWLRFVAETSGAQVVGQVVLTGGPVLLALLGGSPAEVTGLFVALALFRLPYTLGNLVLAPLTAVFTRMVVAGERRRLRTVLLAVLLAAFGLAGLAAVLGELVGPWLLRLVFGPTVDLPGPVCAAVAAGSVLAVGTLLMSLLSMADERSGSLLRCWLGAAATVAVVVPLAPWSPVVTVAVAFLVAESTAFVLLGVDQLRHRH